MKVLLGVTGSVAATLTPKLVEKLLASGLEVRVVVTEPALYFWDHEEDEVNVPVKRDRDEWNRYFYSRDGKVLHIELREWADILLIAPLSANTLAKIANGIADNLLTCVARAWKIDRPVILAPAMNTEMWTHPITSEQLNKLKSWYPKLQIIDPIVKKLFCGTTDIGAMAGIDTITDAILKTQI